MNFHGRDSSGFEIFVVANYHAWWCLKIRKLADHLKSTWSFKRSSKSIIEIGLPSDKIFVTTWLIAPFDFWLAEKNFLWNFNCFLCFTYLVDICKSTRETTVSSFLKRRSPSSFSPGIRIFIYLFSFVLTNWVALFVGNEWEYWHTFHPVFRFDKLDARI